MQEYASYNVLARRPLMLGVPIIPLLVLLMLMAASFFAGIYWLGRAGLVFPLFFAGVLFAVRLMCMENSRAIESLKWDSKGALSRLRCQSSVVSLSSTDDTQKRRKAYVSQFLKDYPNPQ